MDLLSQSVFAQDLNIHKIWNVSKKACKINKNFNSSVKLNKFGKIITNEFPKTAFEVHENLQFNKTPNYCYIKRATFMY